MKRAGIIALVSMSVGIVGVGGVVLWRVLDHSSHSNRKEDSLGHYFKSSVHQFTKSRPMTLGIDGFLNQKTKEDTTQFEKEVTDRLKQEFLYRFQGDKEDKRFKIFNIISFSAQNKNTVLVGGKPIGLKAQWSKYSAPFYVRIVSGSSLINYLSFLKGYNHIITDWDSKWENKTIIQEGNKEVVPEFAKFLQKLIFNRSLSLLSYSAVIKTTFSILDQSKKVTPGVRIHIQAEYKGSTQNDKFTEAFWFEMRKQRKDIDLIKQIKRFNTANPLEVPLISEEQFANQPNYTAEIRYQLALHNREAASRRMFNDVVFDRVPLKKVKSVFNLTASFKQKQTQENVPFTIKLIETQKEEELRVEFHKFIFENPVPVVLNNQSEGITKGAILAGLEKVNHVHFNPIIKNISFENIPDVTQWKTSRFPTRYQITAKLSDNIKESFYIFIRLAPKQEKNILNKIHNKFRKDHPLQVSLALQPLYSTSAFLFSSLDMQKQISNTLIKKLDLRKDDEIFNVKWMTFFGLGSLQKTYYAQAFIPYHHGSQQKTTDFYIEIL